MNIQNTFFIGLISALSIFAIYNYLTEEICINFPHKYSTIEFVFVSENVVVPKNQILIIEYDDNYTNVFINELEDLSDNTILLEVIRNATKSTKKMKIYNYTVEGETIDISFLAQARESICKRRYELYFGNQTNLDVSINGQINV